MITISQILNLYKREDIQNEIIENALDREVAIKFGQKGFGKRPDILKYPKDILELAKQGATSFHGSEELWKNPLQLDPMMKRKDMENLRIGWDLVLDIDCKFLEYSKITADLLIKALKFQGINSISCKFSGGTGFHIAVPFESFPSKVHDIEARLWFPDGPKKVAEYLKEMIKNPLIEQMLKNESVEKIMKKTGKKFNEIVKKGVFNPFSIIGIDTILISSRHLYRMPYSFNEKTGLVSVPINPNKVLEFRKEIAIPKNVRVSKYKFLDRSKVKKNEAKKLLVQAFDFDLKREEVKIKTNKHYEIPEEAVPEQFFPPCIKLILKGLPDGRKRSLFILTNFLTSVGWDYNQIEKRLEEWNKKNPEQLREVLIKGQLRYHKQKAKKIPSKLY
jgi:DNA primase catalytic subunit